MSFCQIQLMLFRNEYNMNSWGTGQVLAERSNHLNPKPESETKAKWSSHSVRLKAKGSRKEPLSESAISYLE